MQVSYVRTDCNFQSEVIEPDGVAAHTLKLPGKVLYLTPLLKAKKFRKFGSKKEALEAFKELEDAKLGTMEEVGAGKNSRLASRISIIYFLVIHIIL